MSYKSQKIQTVDLIQEIPVNPVIMDSTITPPLVHVRK